MSIQGDSLPGHKAKDLQGKAANNPIVDLQTGLRRWISVAFGKKIISVGRRLTIGRQDDGNSCGICVLNAMDHAMFGAPLFQHEAREAIRMDLFLRMANHLLEHVSLFRVGYIHPWLTTYSQSRQRLIAIPGPANWADRFRPLALDPRLLEPTRELSLPAFFNASIDITEDYRESQAFQAISFEGEHAVLNRQWVERCMFTPHESMGISC